jgi:hypothetical protein
MKHVLMAGALILVVTLGSAQTPKARKPRPRSNSKSSPNPSLITVEIALVPERAGGAEPGVPTADLVALAQLLRRRCDAQDGG